MLQQGTAPVSHQIRKMNVNPPLEPKWPMATGGTVKMQNLALVLTWSAYQWQCVITAESQHNSISHQILDIKPLTRWAHVNISYTNTHLSKNWSNASAVRIVKCCPWLMLKITFGGAVDRLRAAYCVGHNASTLKAHCWEFTIYIMFSSYYFYSFVCAQKKKKRDGT